MVFCIEVNMHTYYRHSLPVGCKLNENVSVVAKSTISKLIKIHFLVHILFLHH